MAWIVTTEARQLKPWMTEFKPLMVNRFRWRWLALVICYRKGLRFYTVDGDRWLCRDRLEKEGTKPLPNSFAP